ncbi:hypothetical protein BC829DRAFT_363812, partial [Chytridium lagenaria]
EPAFPQNAPYAVDLVPGKGQPFCDGSHRGTSFTPLKFTVDEAKKYFLCGCKISESKPFCDGTHRKEKGLKRYNEFLLKRNGELQSKLAEADKGRRQLTVVAGVAAVVAVGVVLAVKLRVLE